MDLADLKRELRRLEALAYSPRDALAAAEAAVVYRTLPAFEARMLESHGFLAEAEPWKNKLARLDSATAADVGRLRRVARRGAGGGCGRGRGGDAVESEEVSARAFPCPYPV